MIWPTLCRRQPGAQYVVLADLRRNGILDAIVPDLLANRVVVSLGAGDGTFLGGATYSTGTPSCKDTLTEGAETITLTLSSPGGGAVLGAQRTAVLTIAASD